MTQNRPFPVQKDIATERNFHAVDGTIKKIQTDWSNYINQAVKSTSSPSFADIKVKGPWADVRAFGALGDGIQPDTLKIKDAAEALKDAGGGILFFPPGEYLVDLDGSFGTGDSALYYSILLGSNIKILGHQQATLKLRSGCSSDAAPKHIALFASNVALSNIAIEGFTIDFNGVNNPINGGVKWQALLMFHGLNGRGDDILIRGVTCKNSAGSNVILAHGATDSSSYVLGKRWLIDHCVFINNGLDTNDHSTIWGWCEDLTVRDSIFYQSSIPAYNYVKCAAELHASRGRFIGNRVINHVLGAWVGPNFTSDAEDIEVAGNVAPNIVSAFVRFWRNTATEKAIKNVKIHDNQATLTNNNPGTGLGAMVHMVTNYGIGDVEVYNNRCSRPSGDTYATYGVVAECVYSGQVYSKLNVHDNDFSRLTYGVRASIESGKGTIKKLIVRNNHIEDPVASGGVTYPTCVYVDTPSTLPMDLLVVRGNEFVDNANPANAIDIGINPYGYFRHIDIGDNVYKNMNYATVNRPVIFEADYRFGNEIRIIHDSGMPIHGFFDASDEMQRSDPVASSHPGWVCIGQTTTEIRVAAGGGDTIIEVDSTTGMVAWERIGIELDDGRIHWALIQSITDADTLVINIAIPTGKSAAIDNDVWVMHWKKKANLQA